MIYKSILSLIGNTPIVEVTHLDTGPCRLFVKLESQNPGGSIKDRIALSMIEAAERDGKLKPGGAIVEATAGNTGVALALIAALKGYKVILAVLDKMAPQTVLQCKALGAEVHMAQSKLTIEHPDYYQNMAKRIVAETNGFYINQFGNPANPDAHIRTTGPEIWEQMEHDVDAIVCGVGSGGTITGVGTYFANVSPKTEMILADPEGSILAPLINTGERIKPGSWQVVGIGEDFVPPIFNAKLVKKAYTIPDRESFDVVHDMFLKEGISAGLSSGTLISAALRYCREQKTPKRVVTFVCDQGAKYLQKVIAGV